MGEEMEGAFSFSIKVFQGQQKQLRRAPSSSDTWSLKEPRELTDGSGALAVKFSTTQTPPLLQRIQGASGEGLIDFSFLIEIKNNLSSVLSNLRTFWRSEKNPGTAWYYCRKSQ